MQKKKADKHFDADPVTESVKRILEAYPEKFRALMYRIDLPEHQLVKWIKGSNSTEISEISRLILIREIEKVSMRNSGAY